MANIAYYRVSTTEQSISSQRTSLSHHIDKEFMDEGVSGSVPATKRAGFSALMDYVREGDTVYVYSIDRLGRDALDVQSTVRQMLGKGVQIHIHGIGLVGAGVGELVVAVLAQLAEMEKARIIERCAFGRATAKAHLTSTGKTHKGKLSLGRPKAASANEVVKWRMSNHASIASTAKQFGISSATVSRYCRAGDAQSAT